MKIAFLTDTHLDESAPRRHGAHTRRNFDRVVKALEAEAPDLVVFGGDMGTRASHTYLKERMNQFNLCIIAGNHDNPNELEDNFFTDNGNLFYKRETDVARLIFLDSSSDTLPMQQLEFLQLSLSEKPTLVFIHHPVLPVPSIVDQKYPLANRDAVREILTNHNHPVFIFCGHNHCEHEAEYRNIRQFVTPAVSYQILKHQPKVISDVSYTGYRIISINQHFETKVVAIKT